MVRNRSGGTPTLRALLLRSVGVPEARIGLVVAEPGE